MWHRGYTGNGHQDTRLHLEAVEAPGEGRLAPAHRLHPPVRHPPGEGEVEEEEVGAGGGGEEEQGVGGHGVQAEEAQGGAPAHHVTQEVLLPPAHPHPLPPLLLFPPLLLHAPLLALPGVVEVVHVQGELPALLQHGALQEALQHPGRLEGGGRGWT